MSAVIQPSNDNLYDFELRSRNNGPDPIENLVLEGGGVKGSAYVGVVKALEKSGHLQKLKRVAGSSAGGIMALMIGLGLTAKEIEDEMSKMDFTKFQDYNEQTWAEFFRLGPAIKTFNAIEHFMVGVFSHKKGAYHGDYFMDWAEKWVAKKLGNPNATFKDLHDRIEAGDTTLKDMVFTGTVLAGNDAGLLKYFRYEEDGKFNKMPIAKAVRITMSFPAVFELVEHDGSFYADGGIANNFPMEVFDDPRYLPGMRRTETGKNPRTLGFKVDSSSALVIQKDLVKMAFKQGIIQSLEEPVTEKAYLDTIELGHQEGTINDVERKELLRRATVKSKGLGTYVSNLFSALGEGSKVVDKMLNYRGRAFQIHDQDVATLDFELTQAKKLLLIDAGQEKATKFVNDYQQEQDRSYLDVEVYRTRSEKLRAHLEANLDRNVGNVAICYKIMYESRQQLIKEKNELENSLLQKPDNEYVKEKINDLEKMILISDAWLGNFFNRLGKTGVQYLDSDEAKKALNEYKEYQDKKKSAALESQAEQLTGISKKTVVDNLKSKIEEAKSELNDTKLFEQDLDLSLRELNEGYSFVLDLLNKGTDETNEFRKIFYDSLKNFNELKIKQDKLSEELKSAPPGSGKIEAILVQQDECSKEMGEIIQKFHNKLDATNLPGKQDIEKLFYKSWSNSCNTEKDIRNLIEAEKEKNAASKIANKKSRESCERKIAEAEKSLGDYESALDQSNLFAELVNLRWSLNDEIVKHRSDIIDYLQYGCELLFKGYTDFFGKTATEKDVGNTDFFVATQKIKREREARALKTIVDTAYENYRRILKEGEPETTMLDMIKIELQTARENFEKAFGEGKKQIDAMDNRVEGEIPEASRLKT